MPKYILSYHGGDMPETPEASEKEMNDWRTWMGGLGAALVDGGNPVAAARTIAPNGSVSEGGGDNSVTGYSIIEAASLDEAVAKASSCPQLKANGSIEVGELMDLG